MKKNAVKLVAVKFIAIAAFVVMVQGIVPATALADETSLESIGKVTSKGVRHVNAAESLQILEIVPDVVILDVRTPVEYSSGHLQNAVNINYYSFSFKKQLDKLDRDKTYLLHCHSGVRSGRSIPIMLAAGFKNIIHMDGGYKAWKDHGLPLAE